MLSRAARNAILARVCTLALYLGASRRYPLAIAANRDEFLDRASEPPSPRGDEPWLFAGRDLVAGGTWLGVNAAGMAAGLLNRRTAAPVDPDRRSRGELCDGVLRRTSFATALAFVRGHAADEHNPFNLLLATAREAAVVGNASGRMRRQDLPPGVHVLTNLDLNDPTCPRIAKSHGLFEACRAPLEAHDVDAFLAGVATILADHSTPLDPRAGAIPTNLCVHGERYGTRSSSIILFDAARGRFRYWHADGPPCRADFLEQPLPYPT